MMPKAGLIPHSLAERRVSGLRDYLLPSEVRVYRATTGELLRIEQPVDFETLCEMEKRRK